MSTQIEGPKRTFTAAGAIGRFRRVKQDGSGKIVVAVDVDTELGVVEAEVFKADALVAVRLRTAEGTVLMVADGVIAAEAEVFTAAAGKISATQGGGSRVGVALQAAANDLDEIEILRD